MKKLISGFLLGSLILGGVSVTSFASDFNENVEIKQESFNNEFNDNYIDYSANESDEVKQKSLDNELSDSYIGYNDNENENYEQDPFLVNYDIPLGGSYFEAKEARDELAPWGSEDYGRYEVHHLISREAVNKFADHYFSKNKLNFKNEFLNDYDKQGWVPSIIMKKKDHEQTRSYYNKDTQPYEKNQKAKDFINKQAENLIEAGEFKLEIEDETKDIEEKFGDKYKQAIKQAWSYACSLNFNAPNRRFGPAVTFDSPSDCSLDKRFYFYYNPEK